MKIIIKKSTEGDKAFRIAEGLNRYFNKYSLKNIRKDIRKDVLFGAYFNGEMIGFATYRGLNSDVVELTWVAVIKEYQNKGVGKKLFNNSIIQVRKKYKICAVKTLSEINPDKGYKLTRSFYKQLGFVPLKTIYPYPGWKDPCQIFVKCLRCK